MFDQPTTATGLILIVYASLTLLQVDKRLSFQRKLLRKCRDYCANILGLERLRKLQDDAFEVGPSWKVLPMSYSLMMAMLAITFMFEGKIGISLNIVAMVTLYMYAVLRSSQGTVLKIARMSFVHQFFSLYLVMQKQMADTPTLSRAVITRAFSSIVLFELVDETLFHLVAFSILFGAYRGWHEPLTLLPIRMFFVFVLPLEIIGVREWICGLKLFEEGESSMSEGRREFYIATAIPLMTIFYSFSAGTMNSGGENDDSHLVFIRIIGILEMLLFMVCYWFGDILDHSLMGSTLSSASSLSSSSALERASSSFSTKNGISSSKLAVIREERSQRSSLLSAGSTSSFVLRVNNTLDAGEDSLWQQNEELPVQRTASEEQSYDATDDENEELDGNLRERGERKAKDENNEETVSPEPSSSSSIASTSFGYTMVATFVRLLLGDRAAAAALELVLSNQDKANPSWSGITRITRSFNPLPTLSLTLSDVIFVLTAATMAVSVSFLSFLCLAGLFLFGRYPPTRIIPRSFIPWRRMVAWSHTVMVAYVLWLGRGHDDGHKRSSITYSRYSPALIALMTIRLLFTFERRPFSKVQRETSICGAFAAFFFQDNEQVAILSFLLVSAFIMSLVVCFSREHSASVLKRENDCHAFLSHALKQKFSGVGSATEHILEHRYFRNNSDIGFFPTHSSSTRPQPLSTFPASVPRSPNHYQDNSSLKSLLMSVLQECRKGQDSCHAVNVLRNVKQGKYRGHKSLQILRDMLDQWILSGSLSMKNVTYDGFNEGFVDVEMDWELFKVFLSQWTRGSRFIRISCFQHQQLHRPLLPQHRPSGEDGVPTSSNTRQDGFPEVMHSLSSSSISSAVARNELEHPNYHQGMSPASNAAASMIEMRFQISGRATAPSRDRRLDHTRLAHELNGYFPNAETQDLFVIQCPGSQLGEDSQEDEDSRGSLCKSTTPQSLRRALDGDDGQDENEQRLPPNLTFAILDDNSLVRKNIQRIVNGHLKANKETSFARGSTYEECVSFVEELVERNVDIAILDENLDFDINHLSGTEIGQTARQRGFNGCLLLHSAQSPVSPVTLESFFDGFVEKTTSRHDFVEGIYKAWARYLHRTRPSVEMMTLQH